MSTNLIDQLLFEFETVKKLRDSQPKTKAGKALQKKTPRLVVPHLSGNRKCKHCGTVHTLSQHWSHAHGEEACSYKRKCTVHGPVDAPKPRRKKRTTKKRKAKAAAPAAPKKRSTKKRSTKKRATKRAAPAAAPRKRAAKKRPAKRAATKRPAAKRAATKRKTTKRTATNRQGRL